MASIDPNLMFGNTPAGAMPAAAAPMGAVPGAAGGAVSPYQSGGGQLPWQGQGNVGGMISAAAGGDPVAQQLGNQYSSAYNSALAMNQQNYQNILAGYQTTQQQQQGQQQQISAGYGQLGSQVQNTIQGISASQSQAIADTYAQQSGQLGQSMVNSGLGNTTVQGSMQRGLTLDEQKAQIALSNQFAQLSAGYQSQLGLAGLDYRNQANMQNTAEQNQQLNWMNSVQAQYPDAQQYGNLLAQRGQQLQFQQNQDRLNSQFAQQMAAQQALLKKGTGTGNVRLGGGVSGLSGSSGAMGLSTPNFGQGNSVYNPPSFGANPYSGAMGYGTPSSQTLGGGQSFEDFVTGGGYQTAEPPLAGGNQADAYFAGAGLPQVNENQTGWFDSSGGGYG